MVGKRCQFWNYSLLGIAIALSFALPTFAAPPVKSAYDTPLWIEAIGIFAGVGTTFASLPDCLEMLQRRSSLGIKPRMAAITGIFQVLWLIYGLLIYAPAVIFWNAISILINATTVAVFIHFFRQEQKREHRDRP